MSYIPEDASCAASRSGVDDDIDADEDATSGVNDGGGGKLESVTWFSYRLLSKNACCLAVLCAAPNPCHDL